LATLLDSHAALQEGLGRLCAKDPTMAALAAGGATPALRKEEPGFSGLARIVVGQQVSTASAAAIWARVGAALGAVTPHAVAAADDAALRACGLSAPKMRTLRAAAAAVLRGDLPLDRLHEMSAEEAHGRLTAVAGVGPWTADVYLLFCLGHPDAFPAGDLALQEAARLAYGLPARPSPRGLTALAERWRPWRGVAAKVLWAHYRLAKARYGAPTG